MGEPVWSVTWEDDLSGERHEALAGLLYACFPRSAETLVGARSWISGRPELRLVADDGGRPIAHLGVLRRYLRFDGDSLLVGDVGLVGVHPRRQGAGLGVALLAQAGAVLHDLDLPFGFLTCGERVAGFYARAGWLRVANKVRMVRADDRVQVYGGVAMVLPVHAGLPAWPNGELDRNGYEL